jgi:hypothetical protein
VIGCLIEVPSVVAGPRDSASESSARHVSFLSVNDTDNLWSADRIRSSSAFEELRLGCKAAEASKHRGNWAESVDHPLLSRILEFR